MEVFMSNTSNNFLKIIYFDEMFVSDFMQVIAGGELKKTTEFISEVNSEIEGKASMEAGIGTEQSGLSKIFSFLSGGKINIEVGADANAMRKSERLAKNILENTLLADFIAFLESDKSKNNKCKGIIKFSKIKVRPEKNSFAYLMLIAPYMSMINGQLPLTTNDGQAMQIDVTKIEEAIEKGRGYYDFIADHNGKEIVLRFNRTAFRNSYTMSDLPKMQLTYYGIHVGQIDKSDLQVQKEFEFGTSTVSSRANYADGETNDTSSKLDVYDIVLAGVVE
jgi:hypothetical protein